MLDSGSNFSPNGEIGKEYGPPQEAASRNGKDGSPIGMIEGTGEHADAKVHDRERQGIRRARLICLGLTVLPLIIIAAFLAKDQLDNTGAVARAESAQRMALYNLNAAQRAQAFDTARVSTTENELRAGIYAGHGQGGQFIASLQAQLKQSENSLATTEARFLIAVHKYSLAQAATADVKINLGNPLGRWIIYAGVAGAVAVGDTLFILYVSSDKQRDIENRAIVRSITVSRAQLNAESSDLTKLWIANERQLAGYHQIVLNYAASSRATAKFSLWFGFLFVAAISICALFAHSLASTVASSVIATVGAMVTGFVAHAILRNAENSSKEVLSFFSHPLETQRLLTAQQLIETMPGETQQQAKLLIIKELVRARSSEPSIPKSL